MNEIYWLTRFDSINGFSIALFIIGIVVCFVVLCFHLFCDEEEAKEATRKALKFYGIPFLLGILGVIFVPTTKEAMLIYGLGGIVDYAKGNEKVKQLPDKAVDALERYLDSIEADNEDNEQ